MYRRCSGELSVQSFAVLLYVAGYYAPWNSDMRLRDRRELSGCPNVTSTVMVYALTVKVDVWRGMVPPPTFLFILSILYCRQGHGFDDPVYYVCSPYTCVCLSVGCSVLLSPARNAFRRDTGLGSTRQLVVR